MFFFVQLGKLFLANQNHKIEKQKIQWVLYFKIVMLKIELIKYRTVYKNIKFITHIAESYTHKVGDKINWLDISFDMFAIFFIYLPWTENLK